MKINWARLVAERMRQLPPEQLQNFLETGKGQFKIGGKTIKSIPVRDYVLNMIRGACQGEEPADQREILNQVREEYGRRCGVAAMANIDKLVEEGIICREQKGGKTLLKLQ